MMMTDPNEQKDIASQEAKKSSDARNEEVSNNNARGIRKFTPGQRKTLSPEAKTVSPDKKARQLVRPSQFVLQEEIVGRTMPYVGRIFSIEHLKVLLPDQRLAERELLHHPGGACVIAIDQDEMAYVVNQYRTGSGSILMEVPAGKLEIGEDPLLCAKRELQEEAGIISKKWIHLASVYTSPGYSDELIHIYLALDLSNTRQKLDEGEFLSVEKISLTSLLLAAMQRQIQDAKTVMAIILAFMYLHSDFREINATGDIK